MAAPEANAEQTRYWNEAAGPKWVSFQKVIDAQIGPLGHRAMDRAGIAPGERVGPQGLVVGIDISAPMLARAVEAARAAGVANVRFENADAQTHRFPPAAFDVVYSRFGVMFFVDPVAAFTNLRAALRPGGRLAFVCWQALAQNPWLFLPLKAAAQHLTLPPPPPPDAPGPFSFADPERVREILSRAGFDRIVFEELRAALTVGGGGTVDQAVRFLTEGVGPVSSVLREADPALRPRVAAAVRAAIAPFHTPEGVRLSSAAWIVTALAP